MSLTEGNHTEMVLTMVNSADLIRPVDFSRTKDGQLSSETKPPWAVWCKRSKYGFHRDMDVWESKIKEESVSHEG